MAPLCRLLCTERHYRVPTICRLVPVLLLRWAFPLAPSSTWNDLSPRNLVTHTLTSAPVNHCSKILRGALPCLTPLKSRSSIPARFLALLFSKAMRLFGFPFCQHRPTCPMSVSPYQNLRSRKDPWILEQYRIDPRHAEIY